MAPVSHSHFLDVWDIKSGDEEIVLDCLLPTGIIIELKTLKEALLSDVKDDLWNQAQRYPLHNLLRGKHSYAFTCITAGGQKLELSDENRSLRDVKPFAKTLRLIEIKGDKTEKIANAHISMLIGRGLQDYDNIQSPEISDFRKHMRRKCEKIADDRLQWSWEKRVGYLYPSELSEKVDLPTNQQDPDTSDPPIQLHVTWTDSENENIRKLEELLVPASMNPKGVIDKTLAARCLTTGELGVADYYVLKVSGRAECLLGNYPLSQYMYIRRMVMQGITPKLVLIDRSDVLEDNPPPVPPRQDGNEAETRANRRNPSYDMWTKTVSLYELHEPYRIVVNSVSNVHGNQFAKIVVKACIYHGPETMCDVLQTRPAPLHGLLASYNETLVFEDLQLPNMPRMARLCFLVCSQSEKRTGKKAGTTGGRRDETSTSLAWGNMTVFDYKGRLRKGECKLYLWPISDDDILDTESSLNPLGTVETNEQPDSTMCLKITISDFGMADSNTNIMFPPMEKVLEKAAGSVKFIMNLKDSDGPIDPRRSVFVLDCTSLPQRAMLDQLEGLLRRDPLQELAEQEKGQIWRLRYECFHHYPWSLPRLLNCVTWNMPEDVAQVYALLQVWRPLPPADALELLDFAYADNMVRKYAVSCIRKFNDSDVLQYILQLVQILKYESYLECDLVDFLLDRALHNRQIGHQMFWLLRSEMHVPSVSVRFGLILEAYLRGSSDHIPSLEKQVLSLDKFKHINETVQHLKNIDQATGELPKLLEKFEEQQQTELQMTFDPRFVGSEIIRGNCKVMDSKKKPLWLSWENNDKTTKDCIYFMYKNGDDLRQDMLTLQILRVINNIWQEKGLDLRLNPYQCLSTGFKEGYIEVVTHSMTIAKIQKMKVTKVKSAFNKTCINEYLKENNNDSELARVYETFTRSCAGYCVAMYVLGVGDRHGDNILLRTDGQLFHIDFGHFMGHWKKFGFINKDRPMFLPADVVYALKKGGHDNKNYDKFAKLCEDGYLELRKKSNFLISLFLMMVNTGIPELSNTQDVIYLQDSLQTKVSEEQALVHFRHKIRESLKNQFNNKLITMAHNVTRT